LGLGARDCKGLGFHHALGTEPAVPCPICVQPPAPSPHSGSVSLLVATVFILCSTACATPAHNLPTVESLGDVAPEVAAAAREALETLAKDPRNAERWGRFGMICEANGIIEPARNAYATAVSLPGPEPKLWYRLAMVQARTGSVDDAIDSMRHVTESNVAYAPAYWRLGLWLLDRDDTDAAERAFTRAREIDPHDVSASAGLARVYLQRSENQAAVDVLERTLADNPGDRYAMRLLGTAYQRLGRNEEAEFALAVGALGEPAWADPWTDETMQFRRGFAVRLKDATSYFAAGRMNEAIALLQQLRQEKPDDIALLNHLGEVYVAAGRVDEGVAMLEQVVAREPDRFEAHVNLATAYLKRNELPRARASVDRAIALNPTLGRAHETRGLVLWRGGEEEAAVAAFRTALRWDPRNVRAYVWLGMVEMNRRNPAGALESFGRATRLDPTRVEAWVGVANATMARGEWDRAAAALQHAAQLDPHSPDVKQAAEHLRTARR
jgi:tetratricopeptide (TPR) repeat protein